MSLGFKTEIIAHLDADAFFASVELISRPQLQGKPVMVCGVTSNRGVVTAATYEARRFGVHAGMPVFQARRLCPDGVFLEAHFREYQDVSRRLFRFLENFSPVVSQTSIDEGYLDFSGLDQLYRMSYETLARCIQDCVKRELKITVSIGVATSKLLAKMASAFRKPEGVTVITSENQAHFWEACKVAAIPGFGRRTQLLLENEGFDSVADVARAPLHRMEALLGKRGREIWQSLQGITIDKVSSVSHFPQSISRSQTLEEFTSDAGVLYAASLALLMNATCKLRFHQLWARQIGIFLRLKDFRVIGDHAKFATFHQDDRIFVAELKKLFSKIYPGVICRSVGVNLSDFAWRMGTQLTLFEDDSEGVDKKELMQAIDRLNCDYGSGTVTRATVLAAEPTVASPDWGSSFEGIDKNSCLC